MNLRCVARLECVLGEGPCWDSTNRRLYWFDIKTAKLHAWDGERALLWDLPSRASAAAALADGRLLTATERGLWVFDPDSGQLQPIDAHDLESGFRSNDGRIDANGRFWWSVMDDDGGKRAGSVRSFGKGATELVTDIHIANALCSSPDGTRLYLADGAKQTIFAYDMDPETGALSNRWVFAQTEGQVYPDGACVDAEGFVWNAHWGGWRVVRYAPDGIIDRIVEVPVEQPTSVAFGGEALSTLYVTSARDGLSDDALAAQPLAGSLFALEPGVPGASLPFFQL